MMAMAWLSPVAELDSDETGFLAACGSVAIQLGR
jgi:hypothetical protein